MLHLHMHVRRDIPNYIQRKYHMNTIRKGILIGMTVLGMSNMAVQAQEQHDEYAQHHAEHAQEMAKHHSEMQAKVHEQLHLTAAQEPAWQSFISARKTEKAPARMDHAAFDKMTAPQRMEKWIAASKERIAMQEQQLTALKTFYAVLTPEQKKTFDGIHHEWRSHGHDMHKSH